MLNCPPTLPFAYTSPKFPKSSSFSSILTEPQFVFEKEFSSRKVSEGQKLKLISLITADNLTMKSAAKIVKISYSTAKKVFTKFRQDIREAARTRAASKLSKVQAGYTTVCLGTFGAVTIVSSTAGIEPSSTQIEALGSDNDC